MRDDSLGCYVELSRILVSGFGSKETEERMRGGMVNCEL